MSAHLEQLRKSKGQEDQDDPNEVLLPKDASFVWSVFVELSSARSYGMELPNPITYQDIWCWCELSATELCGWEIVALRQLDTAYIKVQHGLSRANSKNQISRGSSGNKAPKRSPSVGKTHGRRGR